MPIIGIMASSKLSAVGDFESIATVSVGSGGSSLVEFTSIPSTYEHLQIRFSAKTPSGDWVIMRCNGITGSGNYTGHRLQANGSTITADYLGAFATNYIYCSLTSASGNTGSNVGVIDILDYKNTNKYKTVRILSGQDENGSGFVTYNSGLFLSTNAISSISFEVTTYQQYSHFALYGIKGA
jgi:hypothetical protein